MRGHSWQLNIIVPANIGRHHDYFFLLSLPGSNLSFISTKNGTQPYSYSTYKQRQLPEAQSFYVTIIFSGQDKKKCEKNENDVKAELGILVSTRKTT